MSKSVSRVDEVRNSLKQMEPQFKMALAKHVSSEKFLRVVQTAIQTNPKLLECDRTSLFAACMKAAQDSLLPDGKEAALVPFKGQVQYMPMVAGILKKVRNSGDLLSLTSQVVCEHDVFNYWIDERGEHIEHRPQMFSDRGAIIGVYAMAKTKDEGIYIEVLTMDQIGKIKAVSRASNGPWDGPFATEMMKKSAIRRLSKRLPMSTDLENTISADDDMYEFSPPQEEVNAEMKNVSESSAPTKKTSRVKALISKVEGKEVFAEEASAVDLPPPMNESEDIPI
jgi:recombination protein RecT